MTKKIIICISIFANIFLAAVILFLIFGQSSLLEMKRFKDNYDSYSVVADFLKNEFNCYSEFNLGIVEKDGKHILYNHTDDSEVDVDENISKALKAIELSFNEMDYLFSAIRIKNNVITFDSIDGQYKVSYMVNENEGIYVDRAHKGWYHKITRLNFKELR